MASPWALTNQEGLEAVEQQRLAENKEETFPSDFIRKSFRVAELVCGVAAVRKRREESFARGKIYLARVSTDCPLGNLQSLGHGYYVYYSLGIVPSGIDGLVGQFPREVEIIRYRVNIRLFVEIDLLCKAVVLSDAE